MFDHLGGFYTRAWQVNSSTVISTRLTDYIPLPIGASLIIIKTPTLTNNCSTPWCELKTDCTEDQFTGGSCLFYAHSQSTVVHLMNISVSNKKAWVQSATSATMNFDRLDAAFIRAIFLRNTF